MGTKVSGNKITNLNGYGGEERGDGRHWNGDTAQKDRNNSKEGESHTLLDFFTISGYAVYQ